MSARIQRTFEFLAGLHFEEDFYVNQYFVDIYFDINTDSIREQNVALDRIKYFLNERLQNSVFTHSKDTAAIEKYIDAGMKVCTLPEEPYDQIIGIMLISKLNTINEGRLVVTDITISSSMSDGVWCKHSIEENLGPFNKPGWWNDSTIRTTSVTKKNKSKKIVKLIKNNVTWEDLYLGWEETPITPIVTGPSNEVMFANFDNKTDKS